MRGLCILRPLKVGPSIRIILNEGQATVDVVTLRTHTAREVRAQVHYNVVVLRAGDWPWTALTGIVHNSGLVAEVVGVEAAGAVAKVRDVVCGISIVGCDEGDDVDEESGLAVSPSAVQVRVPLHPNL